ncbi:hypothetical protein HD806DRAFT_139641 [Xylariaceae sp. AK1471]|nr:hypothetical protein HD806DRAFT_139641 [Xylariaceae sp. AK1471]
MSPQCIFLSSRTSDFEDDFIEDNFTADRPCQFNDEHLPTTFSSGPSPSVVPRTVLITDAALADLTLAQIKKAYPLSCHTSSTATITAEKAAATTNASLQVRKHVLFHTKRDYNGAGAVQPLTEWALAALNDDFRMRSYNGNIAEWIRGGPQFSPEDMVSVNMSVLRSPRTRTMTMTCTGSTLGSSWSVISMSTPSVSQVDRVAESICAAGLQFDDVPASPTSLDLLDEDVV